jgi:hypothetical protein
VPTIDTLVCVFCRRQPMQSDHRPFCSDRCRLQDLAQWASGNYRAAGDVVSEYEETENSELETQKD